MKKIVLFAFAMLCMVTTASAQTFANGSQVVSLGIGFGSDYGIPVSISYEQGIYDINEKSSIGVGGYLGFASKSEDFAYGEYKYSDVFIAVSGNYHFTGVDKFDFYGGLRLGYDIGSASVNWNSSDLEETWGDAYSASAGGLAYALVAGARYYFSDNWAANLELGYGISVLNVGVSYKF